MEWSWLKFNNLRMALSMTLKFFIILEKGLKLKVRKFWVLSPTIAEIKGWWGSEGLFAPILNRVDSEVLNLV